MAIAVFVFVLIFGVIAGAGLFSANRGAMQQRLSNVISPDTKQSNLLNKFQDSGFSVSSVVTRFANVIPKSKAETSVVSQRMIRAGYRTSRPVKVFNGAKVVTPLVLVGLVLAFARDSSFVIYIAALGLGFLAPDFWLGRQIKKRQAKIRRGLPDVLDLLIICIEAGLSLDHATVRTSQELSLSQPVISDELSMVVLEQRAGRPRSEAWKHLADRTDVDVIRNLVTVLVQAEQFGTSVAKTLRTHSDTLRTQRIQQVEEQAAKTTVKLIFPLVLFIFPSLFVVVLGPAAILMSESFKTMFAK